MMKSNWFFVCCVFQHVLTIHGDDTTKDVCSFTIEKRSAEYFAQWLKMMNGMLAHIHFNFQGKSYNFTEDVIFPDRWIWTYIPPAGGHLYISWPVDYSVYSLDLLNTKTLKFPVTLYTYAEPMNCSIIFGDPNTTQELSNALYNMSSLYFSQINYYYTYSYWCYLVKTPNFYDKRWYNLPRYTGIPLKLYGYRCCRNYVEVTKAVCDISDEDLWNPYLLLPFYIGIIFFLYFPILLVKCARRSVDSDRLGERNRFELLDITMVNDEYVYMKNRGPISISKIVLSIFGLANRHPKAASLVRRVVLVIIYPVIVYIYIALYSVFGKDLIVELVRQRIPCGFASMLGGFRESWDLFLPMFGGPVVSLILYNIIGLFVILVPDNLAEGLILGLPPDRRCSVSLLRIDIETIEKFSNKKCIGPTVTGYRKAYSVFLASVYMLTNPDFWIFTLDFNVRRWRSTMSILCGCCPRSRCLYLVYVPLGVLYVGLCIVEFLFVCVFYGFPIIFFIVTAVCGCIKYFKRPRPGSMFNIECRVLGSVLFQICFLFYMYMMVVITLESFTIIGYFIFFLYLSVIIFPSQAFGYVYFFVMLIVFVYGVADDLEKEYQELLELTIKASKKLEKACIGKEVFNRNTDDLEQYRLREILALTKMIPVSMSYGKVSIDYQPKFEYIRYNHQVPGVKKQLYTFVVDKFYPVHIALFKTVIQILCVQLIVLASIVFISIYIRHVGTEESREVLNVMSIVVVTMCPNLARYFFKREHNSAVRRMKVRQKVIEFWEKEAQPHGQNDQ